MLRAGGGAELAALAQESPHWHFMGVDPAEDMLTGAKQKLARLGAAERVTWVRGIIDDAPEERFDAATALLVLHFLPDDGRRLAALQALHRRLKPGAPLVLCNGCSDAPGTPRFEQDRRIYAAFARKSGAPEEVIAEAVRGVETHAFMLLPEREEALLAEAGFHNIRLYYVGLWFHGWIASA